MENVTVKDNTQTIDRLRKRIDRLIKENEKDLQEMAERGKELVKITGIVRACKDLIEPSVLHKLMLIIVEFESRCERIRRKKPKKVS